MLKIETRNRIDKVFVKLMTKIIVCTWEAILRIITMMTIKTVFVKIKKWWWWDGGW